MRTLAGGRLAIVAAAVVAALGCGATIAVAHTGFGVPQTVLLLLVATLVVFERRRYGGDGARTGRPTGERFRDPVSGDVVEVCYDDRSGARSYRRIA